MVANRLTEDPTVSVLVLEAGVSDEGMQNVQIPFLGPSLTPSKQDESQFKLDSLISKPDTQILLLTGTILWYLNVA